MELPCFVIKPRESSNKKYQYIYMVLLWKRMCAKYEGDSHSFIIIMSII